MTRARRPLDAIVQNYRRILNIESNMIPEEFTRRTGTRINLTQGAREMEAEIELLNEALGLAQNILAVRNVYRSMQYG